MMKWLLKRMAVVLLVGCICMGILGEIGIVSAAVIEDMDGDDPDYEQGAKGGMQVQSDSHSLKEGEVVEYDILYNSDKFKGPMVGFSICSSYDKDILEYVGVEIKDEHKIENGAVIQAEEIRENSEGVENYGSELSIVIVKYLQKDFDKSDCIATVKYRLKKDVSSVLIYVNGLSLVVQEEDLETYQYGYKVNLTDTQEASPKLTLSTDQVQGSEEITVPINIEQNDGFNLLGLEMNYDTSLFTYEALEIDSNLQSKISLDSIYEAPGSGKIKASFIALEDIAEIGDFLKLKLKVKDGVPAGTTSNIEVGITQVGNKAETSMSGTGTTCAVSITGTSSGEEQQPLLGDVNADKKIDLVDAVYILQNYNQVREFTAVQETTADVTKDGTVNLVDALMIMKYFNGEVAEF